MNAPERLFLPDIQASGDTRQLAIQRVGVKGLRYPLALAGRDGAIHHTVAQLNMYVALPAEQKGTHMSRFVEIVERARAPLTPAGLAGMLDETLVRLGAGSGRIELAFPYFVRKQAPVSGVESLLDVDVEMVAECQQWGPTALRLKVAIPVTSLCPCSKEISRYGAHNQRSRVSIDLTLRADMDIEEIVAIAEAEASCAIFGLLKRPDEKWVTERAYENPKFVEDMVRDIALRLKREPRVARFAVESENFESIHHHSAYALIEGVNA